MRLVKSGCEFFPRLVSVSSVCWLEVDRGASDFSRMSFFPLECRRASGEHSLLSARLLARKAPGDLSGSRKENAVSSSNRTFFLRNAHGIFQTRDIRDKIEVVKFGALLVRWFGFGSLSLREAQAASGM